MWCASRFGWFSIVKKQDGFHVRARVRQDLENLIKATGLNVTIRESHTNDYRWRVVVSPMIKNAIIDTLSQSIDYSNFKSTVQVTHDQADKLHAYHKIWAIMNEFQQAEDRPKRKPLLSV